MSTSSMFITTAEPLHLVDRGRFSPWVPAATMLASDVCGLALSFGISILVWSVIHGRLLLPSHLDALVSTLLFVASFAVSGLYRTVGLTPVEELRRSVLAIAGTFLLLVFITFVVKQSTNYSRGMIVSAWCCATIIIPVTRLIVKPVLGKCSWFAKPVAVLGGGAMARSAIATLRNNTGLALRPVVAFSDHLDTFGTQVEVPVVGGLAAAPAYCRRLGIDYAIIAMPEASRRRLVDVMRTAQASFQNVLVLPDLFGVSSLWVEARDIGGILGLELRNNLLQRSSLAAKRMLDLALILIGSIVVLPLCLLIALCVKLQSPGPVFYAQRRVGRGGQAIRVWKFRTMLADADELLRGVLCGNPDARAEWSEDHKLKDDPRVTTFGRFLRKTSLDELPQLWNVLKGEMSLVGPRPIVEAEIPKFGDSFEMYTRVPPGITGPWQVSGRNRVSYDERVRLNEHYVRNWSIWLDLFILFRTVRVVLSFDGAY